MAQDDGEELSTTHSDSDGTLSEDDYASDHEDDDVEYEDVLQSEGALEYEAPVAGRSLGVQPIPRFDIDQLRPFEVMFCDHKDYDSTVRGGANHAFVLIDVKTRAKFKIDQTSKTQAGLSFSRIMAMNGVHKLPYKCRIYSDGCGSMKYVEKHATRMGIDHAYTPPHEASLNEAEKICDWIWARARILMTASGAPESLFGLAVDHVLYIDMRMATTSSRGFKTPCEMIKGEQPNISHLRPFWCKSYVTAPKSKRKWLKKKEKANISRFRDKNSPWKSANSRCRIFQK